MKKIMFITIFILMGSSLVSCFACTTIIVGSKATNDGSIIIARNEDSSTAHDAQNMIYHPVHKESFLFNSNSIDNPNSNKFTYKLPKNSLSYIAFPHWSSSLKENYSFEETGINEYGVAISATETIFNSDKALKIDPYLLITGTTEDSITSVVLPQATSAKEGVRILGNIVENIGAGEGFGVAFSDRNEAWYLETASGHHWLAMRIPDDSYFVSANQGRFQEAELNDTMNVLSSKGLLDFAISNKLFDPKQEPFNFFKCYISNTPHDITYNYPRVKTLLQIYSNYNYDKNDGLYPVFMQPKKKMTVWDVAAGLRNKYNGTPNDPYQTKNPKEINRPICVLRASLSHITQTRPDLPDDIAYTQYIALGMTDLSVYIPFYKGITNIPKEYQGAKDKADNDSMFWKYRKMQVLVLQDYPRFSPMVHASISKFEKDISLKQAEMEKKYLNIYLKDRALAKKIIQDFTNTIIAKESKMVSDITTKIAKALGMENLTNEQYTDLLNKTEATYHFHGA
ncbi:MAG: C69 family dipeptidase [Desulfobacterales bacterium]|nr:C69 family dipeptidase [Desulfobacterales bacterium]MBF0396640.1 C69 family dipeptidase [Desulfobacterales bacterium]